jgi:hypothetical protein
MRFMVLVPANKDSEAGVMPTHDQLAEMQKYTEELVKAGVVLAGDGLHPSSKGARIRFEGGTTKVLDGPFAESKELVAGYSIWQVGSREEAIEWVKRAPFGKMHSHPVTVELRQIFDPSDFAASDPTGELGKRAAELRAQASKQS